jgi:hypothetical protein
MIFEDLKLYLPKYLSSESENDLFKGLTGFPENIDTRLYTNYLSDSKVIYQGDGIHNLLVVNLPQTEVKPVPGMVFSNTCDIDLSNQRNFPSQIVYAPIFQLEKYRSSLCHNSKKTSEQINNHISAIKKQEITQIFYLPKLSGRIDESIVFLDRLNNMPNKLIDRESIPDRRIFTLSNYGTYLFLIKLSIHFTRIQDKVDRKF